MVVHLVRVRVRVRVRVKIRVRVRVRVRVRLTGGARQGVPRWAAIERELHQGEHER